MEVLMSCSYLYGMPVATPYNPNYLQSDLHSTPVASIYYPSAPPENEGFSSEKRTLTQAIHHQTEALFREMESVANRTLGQEASLPSGTFTPPSASSDSWSAFFSSPINIDFSDRSWNWGNRTEVHHHHQGETDKPTTNSSSSNNHTATRIALGVVGFLGAGIASYWIGKTCAQGEDANRASATYEDLKKSWKESQHRYLNGDANTVNRIIKVTDSLKGREKRNRIQKLALFALMFIAGAAAVGGAIVRSRFLVTSAVAIGAFTLLAALFKYGYSSFSKGHLKDAEDIQGTLNYLRRIFAENYNVTE